MTSWWGCKPSGRASGRPWPQARIRRRFFSFNTYKSYWKHTKYFIQYIKEHHPECTTLKSARKYVNEWLQARADQGLSAWTIQLEAKTMGKLYGISPDDENYFKPPNAEPGGYQAEPR